MRYGMTIDETQQGKALASAWVEPHPDNPKRFMVKGRTLDGTCVLHLGPDDRGWDTGVQALAFAHRSTREGVSIRS